MAMTLEELYKQRAQIQQHLDWLDAKIAEAKTQGETEASTEPAQHAQNTATSPQPSRPPEQVPSKRPIATSSAAEDNKEAPAADTSPLEAPDIESSYKPKTQSEVLRAKIGCVAFFIIMIGLFLFTLFVLPYLW